MHVLLGTDGSELALEATKRGLALLSGTDRVTLLSVVSDLPADTGGGIEGPLYTPEQEESILKSETDHATKALSDTRAVVSSVAPKATIDDRVEMGDPAAMICHVAGELGVDVIVVGSHGKGFVSRVLLGSVSEYVMRHAPCPVLVVRAPNTEHHDE